ncbi:MAG: nitrogenase component 1 [Sideroxydans sp.]
MQSNKIRTACNMGRAMLIGQIMLHSKCPLQFPLSGGRGEKRLFHAIKQAVDSYSPKAVFIYNTCVPALTGDDISAVCKSAAEKTGVPVIPVDCAGFYGAKNLGNRIAPGPIFSAQRGFSDYVRLNYGHLWNEEMETAIAVLGKIIL